MEKRNSEHSILLAFIKHKYSFLQLTILSAHHFHAEFSAQISPDLDKIPKLLCKLLELLKVYDLISIILHKTEPSPFRDINNKTVWTNSFYVQRSKIYRNTQRYFPYPSSYVVYVWINTFLLGILFLQCLFKSTEPLRNNPGSLGVRMTAFH